MGMNLKQDFEMKSQGGFLNPLNFSDLGRDLEARVLGVRVKVVFRRSKRKP